MKAWMFALVIFILTGCRAKEHIVSSSKTDLSRIEKEVRDKYFSRRDTLIMVKLPLQKSESIGRDTSMLETDYSVSLAIWDGRRLYHSIWNKPEVGINVPGGIMESVDNVKTDVAHDYRDVEFIDRRVEVEKYRFMNAWFYYSGLIAWLIGASGLVFLIIKKRRWF